MRTKEMLTKMPDKCKFYLESLRDNIKQAKLVRQDHVADELKAMGKGYIKGLVDCGVIDDFKVAWCWFTL